MNGLTDYKVLHTIACHRVSNLNTILELDNECDHFVHCKVKNLETSRRLDVAPSVLVQTYHGLLANLAPSIVRNYRYFSLYNFSCHSDILSSSSFHAKLAQILVEACLDLIYR